MTAKFSTMAEKDGAEIGINAPIVIEAHPGQFNDLWSARQLQAQEQIESLKSNGFESQVTMIEFEILSSCMEEIAGVHGFRKISRMQDAFNQNIFRNMRTMIRVKTSLTFSIAVAILLSYFSVRLFIVSHNAPSDSESEIIGGILCGLTAVVSIVMFVMLCIDVFETPRNIQHSSWASTTVRLTYGQTAKIRDANNLEMFSEVNVCTRFNDTEVSIVGTRSGLMYWIA